MSIMTRQDKIDVLQDWVSKNYITTADSLKEACKHEKATSGEDIDWYEDILSPMEWNCCDRCGDLWESDRLYWEDFDTPDEDVPDSIPISKAVELEGGDYCALCSDCVKALKEQGERYELNNLKGDYNA